jgi:hypothetical protein
LILHGKKLQEIELNQDILRDELQRAFYFWKSFATKICNLLQKKFEDISILACMTILAPTTHPRH